MSIRDCSTGDVELEQGRSGGIVKSLKISESHVNNLGAGTSIERLEISKSSLRRVNLSSDSSDTAIPYQKIGIGRVQLVDIKIGELIVPGDVEVNMLKIVGRLDRLLVTSTFVHKDSESGINIYRLEGMRNLIFRGGAVGTIEAEIKVVELKGKGDEIDSTLNEGNSPTVILIRDIKVRNSIKISVVAMDDLLSRIPYMIFIHNVSSLEDGGKLPVIEFNRVDMSRVLVNSASLSKIAVFDCVWETCRHRLTGKGPLSKFFGALRSEGIFTRAGGRREMPYLRPNKKSQVLEYL